VWGSIIMTALADLANDDMDWEHLGIDDVVSRLEATFAEFTGLVEDVRHPV
jgi:hypothetical protein